MELLAVLVQPFCYEHKDEDPKVLWDEILRRGKCGLRLLQEFREAVLQQIRQEDPGLVWVLQPLHEQQADDQAESNLLRRSDIRIHHSVQSSPPDIRECGVWREEEIRVLPSSIVLAVRSTCAER